MPRASSQSAKQWTSFKAIWQQKYRCQLTSMLLVAVFLCATSTYVEAAKCNPAPGYTVYEHWDSTYYDMGKVPASPALIALCNVTPGCVGFGSLGFLKTYIRPVDQWRALITMPQPISELCVGIYVKNNYTLQGVPPTDLPDAAALLALNSTWDKQTLPASCTDRVPGFVFLPAADTQTAYANPNQSYMQYGTTDFRGDDIVTMASACLREPDCTAFSSWASMYHNVPPNLTNYSYASYVLNGRCIGLYVKASATTRGCPSVPGFAFYPNLYPANGTVSSSPGLPLNRLASICNSSAAGASAGVSQGCAAFTTWGDIKGSALDPYSTWRTLDPRILAWADPAVAANCSGTYVRIGADVSTPTPAYPIVRSTQTYRQDTIPVTASSTESLLNITMPETWNPDWNRVYISWSGVLGVPLNLGDSGTATVPKVYANSTNQGPLKLQWVSPSSPRVQPLNQQLRWVPPGSSWQTTRNATHSIINLGCPPGGTLFLLLDLVNNGWFNLQVDITFEWAALPVKPSPPPLLVVVPGAPDASDDSSDSNSVALAVGLGVGLGVGLLLLAGAAAWLVIAMRRRRQQQEAASAKLGTESEDSGGDCAGASAGGAQPRDAIIPVGATTKEQQQLDSPPKSGSEEPSSGTLPVAKGEPNAAVAGSGASWNMSATSNSLTAPVSADSPGVDLQRTVEKLKTEMGHVDVQILSEIGKGGYSVVYKGIWRGMEVAVKRLVFQQLTGGKEGARREAVLQEAALHSVLSHPNILVIYNWELKQLGQGLTGTVGVEDWYLYIIQEFADGGSLYDALRLKRFWDTAKNRPRMDVVLALLSDVASAMAYLHSKNIIHGDLKPDNVLLKTAPPGLFTRSGGYQAKVADFGLSLFMQNDKTHVSGIQKGTPLYIAPELVLTGKASTASDVYSFGVMMWEMYHGVSAWEHAIRTAPAALAMIKQMRPVPGLLSFHEPCKYPAYKALVQSCLLDDPAGRPEFNILISMLNSPDIKWTDPGASTSATDGIGMMGGSARPNGANMGVVRPSDGAQGPSLLSIAAAEAALETQEEAEAVLLPPLSNGQPQAPEAGAGPATCPDSGQVMAVL